MIPFILYSKVSSVTGKALCQALGWDGGTKAPAKKPSVLFRWGCSYAPDLDLDVQDAGGIVFNPADSVAQTVNRRDMLFTIRDCVPHEHTLRVGRNPQIPSPLGYISRHMYGRWGNDIVDISSGHQPTDYEGRFVVERWPGDFEVRVHLIDGKSVAMQVKLRKDEEGNPIFARTPGDTGALNNLMIRNEDTGWHLYPLSTEQADELGIDKRALRDVAKSCMRGFGLDYGCVDFLVRVPGSPMNNTNQQTFRVLELNSSPGLRGSTLDAYVRGLDALVSSEASTQRPREPRRVEGEEVQAISYSADALESTIEQMNRIYRSRMFFSGIPSPTTWTTTPR